MSKFTQILPEVINRICSACFGTTNAKSVVELRILLKQGKEKAQTRKGKKTACKEKRLLARTLEKARKRLSRQNLTKKCVNVRGEKASILQKGQLLQES